MATDPVAPEAALRSVQIAVLAKAPIAGLAKTRLIPALGAQGAARLQRQFASATVRCALDAGLGPVTLWCAPSGEHRFFRALACATGVRRQAQPDGDLGVRMHAAFTTHCPQGPLLLVGTDCPVLTAAHLRAAAQALVRGDDAVVCPAEDGGYVMVGLREPQAGLFADMPWSTERVLADTRIRARAAGLRWTELDTLWDVDVPADLPRLERLRSDLQRTKASHA